MVNDKVKATGIVSFVLTDENGNVKLQEEKNLVVDAGLAFIASRMVGTAKAVMSHMAVGTGVNAAADADSTLQTEAARVALTSTTIVTTNVANDAVQFVATFNPGTPGPGTIAITEAGIFNAASNGDMLCRTKFDVINKGDLDTLTITWKVTIA